MSTWTDITITCRACGVPSLMVVPAAVNTERSATTMKALLAGVAIDESPCPICGTPLRADRPWIVVDPSGGGCVAIVPRLAEYLPDSGHCDVLVETLRQLNAVTPEVSWSVVPDCGSAREHLILQSAGIDRWTMARARVAVGTDPSAYLVTLLDEHQAICRDRAGQTWLLDLRKAEAVAADEVCVELGQDVVAAR